MYQPKSIPYIEQGLQRPMGMKNRLKINEFKSNLENILFNAKRVITALGVATIISLYSYEIFIKPIYNYYQTKDTTKSQREAGEHFKHISEDPTFR